MSAVETLFSFVNRWECDENDHLNVQFYFSRFDEADRQFRLVTGLSDANRESCIVFILVFYLDNMDIL